MAVSTSYKPAVAEKLRSQRTEKWGDSNVHCCTCYCGSGYRRWADWDNAKDSPQWQGHEGLEGSGTIGLLLDFGEGTLSVFKNGRRLGVMKDGLGGEYSWFVSFSTVAVGSSCTIKISKGLVPN